MGKKKIKQLDIGNRSTGIDLQKTVQCLQSPDKANDAHIQFTYGTRCMKNVGMLVTKENILEAKEWFSKSAAQGYAPAHLSLGILYIGAYPESHLGAIERNELQALTHFQYAAEKDIPEAQYRLALLLKKTPHTLESAVSWLRKAAMNHNHKGAKCHLGLMYLKGNQVVDQNKEQGIEMLKQAAQEEETETLHLGRAGAQRTGLLYRLERAEALYHLGLAYEKGDGVEKNDAEALEFLEQAAKMKHKDALLHLAAKYESGDGVPKDNAVSTQLLIIAANAGYPEAQFYLAIKYKEGVGIEKNESQALALLTKAAEGGYKEAQFNLAIKYEEGSGVEKDESQALALLTKAAKNGYKPAQFHLGVKYCEGRGIEKEEIKAVDWLTRAAEGKHTRAIEYLGNLIEKNLCLNNVYSGAKQLIRVSQNILGEKYDIAKIFHNLLPEGIPELDDEAFYYYTYQLFPSEESIPAEKEPGIVYLYIKNDKFNYILNSCSSDLEGRVYSGALDLPAGVDLRGLQDALEKQLIQNKCIEPSYEVRLNMQEQYKQFSLYENNLTTFLVGIMNFFESKKFYYYAHGNNNFYVLRDNINTTAANLVKNQMRICKSLEREFKDSSQMIDTLKEAYATTINLEDFYNMGCYLKQLDEQLKNLPAEEKTFIHQSPDSPTASSNSINEASFQAIFFEQYTLSRKMLFQSLSTYFRKKHSKFYDLEPIFIMFEKMVFVSNMARDNTPLMVMSNLQTQLKEENNIFKTVCFQLIQPIFYLLIMETQQTSLSAIYKNLLEIQKPLLLQAMLDLKKQVSDFKSKSDIKTEITLYPNAENIQELLENLEGTSNLSDIIGLLIKVIQMIEPLVLELNASKTSPELNRRSSNGSSEHTQSLGSLQGTSEDLLSEQVLMSPKGKEPKSELRKDRRKSILSISNLGSRIRRRNQVSQSVLENEHDALQSSALLSSTIGNDSQKLILFDDIGLSSSNRSGSENTPSNLSNTIENSDNTEEDLLTELTSSYIRENSCSPVGHKDSAINSASNDSRSGSQQEDITRRASKKDGARFRNANKRKSIKEISSFFATDDVSDMRNRLSSSSKPNFTND